MCRFREVTSYVSDELYPKYGFFADCHIKMSTVGFDHVVLTELVRNFYVGI